MYHLSNSNHLFRQDLKQNGNNCKGRVAMSSLLNTSMIIALIALLLVAFAQAEQVASQVSSPSIEGQSQPSGRMSLEEELNSIVRQHDNAERNDKKLAEALISKILIDGITTNNDNHDQLNLVVTAPNNQADLSGGLVDGEQLAPSSMFVAPDWRFKQWLNSYDAGDLVMPYPTLPNSQVGTIKRAAKLAAKNHQRLSGYGRPTYDFGLGKRPDSGGLLARYGDQASSNLLQPVSQFGKRPSAHRYDFGLGKRVASPTYPRYDFGLGKRAPNYVRYDFGLGK